MKRLEEFDKEVTGRRIVKLMKENDLTLNALAEDLRCNYNTVFHWTHGDTAPTAFLLFELCRYFDVSADWILGLSNRRREF